MHNTSSKPTSHDTGASDNSHELDTDAKKAKTKAKKSEGESTKVKSANSKKSVVKNKISFTIPK